MNVQKFIAANSREALRKVRDALGPEAMILSNRSIAEGVEVVALAAEDMAALTVSSADRDMQPDFDWGRAPQRETVQGRAAALQTRATPVLADTWSEDEPEATPASVREMANMMQEIRAMRGMLEIQLAELAWDGQRSREPHRAQILRDLLTAGFSPGLSRHLLQHLPEVANALEGMQWVKAALARNLNVMHNELDVLERGGVFALVGPTGVGKTTTTAKLAARCVMRHGPNKLALITTDGYRVGAHEQLRIYGKILGVMVHSVRDESDLRIALAELRGKHTVLIDTVGMNQRDQMVAEQAAMLAGAGVEVQRLLCLNATSTGETLNEVVRAYQGSGLAGCIITKLDEAATMGNVLDVIIRHKLRLYYAANGQRVPEDLHLMSRELLVDRAFRVRREMSAFRFQDEELSLMVSAARGNDAEREFSEVRLG
ncbi:MAG: flagellar biosynthesis protein FlhF [Betaproteobacteria bacterium]|nr:flagellar biosynthesis protein FlhF [Betaproteobacteria bacterium]